MLSDWAVVTECWSKDILSILDFDNQGEFKTKKYLLSLKCLLPHRRKIKTISREHTALSHKKLFTTAAVGTLLPPSSNRPCGIFKIDLVMNSFSG